MFFKSFKYKAKLLRTIVTQPANRTLKNVTALVPLKYLSNFWKSFKIPLINSKVELKLKWTKHCVSTTPILVKALIKHNDLMSKEDKMCVRF